MDLWRYVPALELNRSDFSDSNDLVTFVDKFLRFNSDSLMQSFKYYSKNIEEGDIAHVMRWISIVVERKVKHIHFQDGWFDNIIEIPSTLFTCESLESLTLSDLDLPCPEFVALSSLKVMHLIRVRFADSLVLVKLLSNSPVLESLSIRDSFHWDMEVLVVRSHSLLSFVYAENHFVGVEIDAPRLEYLCIDDQKGDTFVLDNLASLVKVDMDIVFNLRSEKKFNPNDEPKRNKIRNFLLGISSVKEMIIYSRTLKVFYAYSRCEPLPVFRNLAFLRVKFCDNSWESLPFLLESRPNLKSLVVVAVQMGFARYLARGSIDDTLHGTCCLLASLEYAEISTLLEGEAMAMKLVENMDEIGVDRLRNLPDSLLIQILLNLTTKDVVKTSVLSTKWKNFWRYVPALELDPSIYPNHNNIVRFVDSFLRFHRETLLEKFVLKFNGYVVRDDFDHVRRCISTVAERNKVQHLHVSYGWFWDFVEMPSTIYTCESLVSLKLSAVMLPSLEFVSLPSLRVMYLDGVTVANRLVLETLISHSPVLESLSIRCRLHDNTQVLRVCSHSLLSFVYAVDIISSDAVSAGVAIDTPRLEYLSLAHNKSGNIVILNNPASLVKVNIDAEFKWGVGKHLDRNDLPRINMMRNFILGISSVKEMIISLNTLKVIIFAYSRCEPLPLFRNLAFLHVKFFDYRWTLLPFFLDSCCPNLKSLVVVFEISPEMERIDIYPGSRCPLASLEYVEIKWSLEMDEMVMKLVGYLLLKSTNLKKLTLTLGCYFEELDESFILERLNAIPRVSSICQVAVRLDSLSHWPRMYEFDY